MTVQPQLMNPAGAAAIVFALVAFVVVNRWLCVRPLRLRVALLFVFSFLAVPGLLFAVYYLHVFAEQAWFYELRSWRGSEFLAVFIGCAGGAAAAVLPRILLGLPLVAVFVLTALPHVKPLLGGLPDAVFQERWEKDVCLQSTPSTCGPASVATILRSLEIPVSEKAIARAAFNYGGGTEAWYLARHARKLGAEARFDFRESFSPAAGLPAVVGVRLGGLGHFIAVLKFADGQITFADPLNGRETLPLAEFERRYTFTGFHMVLSKPK